MLQMMCLTCGSGASCKSRVGVLFVDSVSGIGGAEFSLLQLASHLDPDSFRPHLVTSCEGPLSQRFVHHGIPVFYAEFPFFSKRRPWLYMKAIWALRSIVKKHHIRLVHVNCDRAVPHSVLAAKLAGVPCVCHIRDTQRAWFLPSYVRHLNRADAILVNSQATRHACIAAGMDESKLVVAYPGVDLAPFLSTGLDDRHAVREEFDITDETVAIAIIGQILPHKGHEEFVHAAARVLSQNPHTVFLIVGDDALAGDDTFKRSLVDQIEAYGLSKKVIFTGFRDDIPRVLAGVDIVAAPSWRESFGRVIVEALASRKPVVATAAGGIPEILEDGLAGILIPPGDVSALAKSLIRLCREPDLRYAMGQNGPKTVIRFDVNNHARELERLYMSLLEPRGKER